MMPDLCHTCGTLQGDDGTPAGVTVGRHWHCSADCLEAPTDCLFCGEPMDDPAEQLAPIRGAARTLWSVRVLDAWARQHPDYKVPSPECVEEAPDGNPTSFRVVVPSHALAGLDEQGNDRYRDRLECFGATEDAARLAAAEAVLWGLPADVRAKLGVRP